MNSFLTTVIATIGIMLVFCLGLSALNANTVQQVVDRTGKPNSQLWLMRPGIFVHELLHAVVGRLFGLQVTQFSMRPSGMSVAHVSFAYNRRSLRHQLGLGLASTAPLWGITAILLLVGKHAWYPGVAWRALFQQAPHPQVWWVVAWLVLVLMLTFGASLSKQDLRNTLGSLPILLIGLLGAFAIGHWLYAPLLVAWQQVNVLLAMIVAVMLGIALVVNRLCAWL